MKSSGLLERKLNENNNILKKELVSDMFEFVLV